MTTLNRREFLAAGAVAACACALCPMHATAMMGAASTFDAGPLTDFAKDGALDKFATSQQVILIRKDGRLYATAAVCTHREGKLKVVGSELRCTRHGARYSLEGKVTKGPAKLALVRFGISL